MPATHPREPRPLPEQVRGQGRSGALTIHGSDDVTTDIGNTGKGGETIRVNERGNGVGSYRGDDTVDCGAGNDTVYYDPGDTVRDCEVGRDLQGNPQ